MTLTAEKLPFRGDTFQTILATVDRIVPFVHTTCQWEQEGYAFPCGRKAHHTCTVCEVTLCSSHDCGCER